MREKRVVVAIVQDNQGRFLVSYNARWGGYAFPMKDLAESADVLGSVAIRAVEDDLGLKLPNAHAKELEYLSRFGRSGPSGADTKYEYWLYDVNAGQTLELPAAPTWNNNPPMFLSFAELSRRTDLTWSTASIAREFVENQDVVLAVVSRAGEKETEFLLVWNDNYGGYFFPAQRVKTESKPENVAVATIRSDLGYRGPARAARRAEVPDVHFSNRFQRERRYRFHICDIQFADLDMHQPCGPLEQALGRRGKKYLWLPGSRLADATLAFSGTMPAVREMIIHSIPAQILSASLRQSEGATALFERRMLGKTEWLGRWNDNWGVFFFVGGHRQEGESFRECVIREIGEELGLAAADFTVAQKPAHHVEYKARSQSAGDLTAYTMEFFAASLTPQAAKLVDGDPHNRWLTEDEIRRLEAHDARPISPTMHLLLNMTRKNAPVVIT